MPVRLRTGDDVECEAAISVSLVISEVTKAGAHTLRKTKRAGRGICLVGVAWNDLAEGRMRDEVARPEMSEMEVARCGCRLERSQSS